MKINLNNAFNEKIQSGDLVTVNGVEPHEAVGIVVDGGEDSYNVVIFNTQEPHEVYLDRDEYISYTELENWYTLLQKSDEVEIAFKF